METTIANTPVSVNEEGYLTDLNQWTPEVARVMAREFDLELTDTHWKVIDYLQEQFRQEVPLTIRRVGKSGVVSIKEFYALFPNGPLKISSKIAGIPKPVSCI